MSSRRHEPTGQESLITAAQQGGQFHTRDFSAESAAVNRIDQKLDLMNCLGHLAAASMRDGLIRIGEDAIRPRYGERATAVIEGAKSEKAKYINDAKRTFAFATGHYALIDSGLASKDKAQETTRGLFSDFLKKFYGARHYDEAQHFMRSLGNQVSELQDIEAIATVYNRDLGLRPHEPVAVPSEASKEEKQEFQELNSRQRMQAILFDPRAAFLPATNREKTMVMTFLDYLDNPEHPLGINDQLWECLLHQQKGRTDREALSVYESKTWEMGDYLADAARGYELVSELLEILDHVSPRHKVADVEELEAFSEAVAYLIRYDAIEHYVATDDTGGLGDVLFTKEVGRTVRGSDPGKHKTVHSRFTMPAEDQPEETAAYIAERKQVLTVKDLKKLANKSIANDINRGRFMVRRLTDVVTSPRLGELRRYKRITDAARASYEVVRNTPLVQLLADERAKQAA
jgi:hypothetical protein